MKKLLSCLLVAACLSLNAQVTIAIQDFEATPASPTLMIIDQGAQITTQSGSTTASDRPANVPKYTSGTQSIGGINTGASGQSINFAAINTAAYDNLKLEFNLASFSVTSTSNGAEASDFVDVFISTDGLSFSQEMRITGFGTSNASWGFSATTVASKAYDGNNFLESSATFAPTSGGASTAGGLGKVVLTNLPITNTLYVRLVLRNNAAAELWAIDDVKISGNVSTSPVFIPSAYSLKGMNYLFGSGPSIAISYRLFGTRLSPAAGNIAIAAPANFEVSLDNVTFGDNLQVSYTDGALPNVPIFVRLKSGLALGNYGGSGIYLTHTGGGAAINITLRGTVSDGSACGSETSIAAVRLPMTAQQTYTGTAGVTIRGKVAAILGPHKFYVQDASNAGIVVYQLWSVPDEGLVLGDEVKLTGTPVRFNGEAEMTTLTCLTKLSGGAVPMPIVFDANNPPTGVSLNDFLMINEGALVKIIAANVNSVGNFASNTNYSIITCNSQGGTEIRIDATTTTLSGTVIPTATQDVVGVVSRYINANGTDKLQIFPRFNTDFLNSATACTISGGCGVVAFIDDPAKLDVVNWNVEWLGHPTNGPSQSGVNDATQIANVQTVLNGIGADVFVLEEVSQYNATDPTDVATMFGKILQGLNATFGANAYAGECSSGFSTSVVDANPQRVCVVYKKSVVTKVFSRPMFQGFTPATYPPTGDPSKFWASGRKPFQFMAKVQIDNKVDTILFVGLHAKSGSDSTSYKRRKYDVKVMYDSLQAQYPDRRTIVIGDTNDDVDGSIYTGAISSYAPFLYANPNETAIAGTRPNASWDAIAKPLTDARCASTATFPDYIDHQIVSNEFDGSKTGFRYLPGSISSVRPAIPNYSTTTSDHFLTASRFEFFEVENCKNVVTLSAITDDYGLPTSIKKQAWAASGKIAATNQISGMANVTYQASSIELNPGFRADNGTVFKAEVGGCY